MVGMVRFSTRLMLRSVRGLVGSNDTVGRRCKFFGFNRFLDPSPGNNLHLPTIVTSPKVALRIVKVVVCRFAL